MEISLIGMFGGGMMVGCGATMLWAAGLYKKVRDAHSEREILLTRTVEAETTEGFLEQQLAAANAASERAQQAQNAATRALAEAEKRAALAEQKVSETEKRMADWEAAQAQSVQMARSAVMNIGQELSSKLLADHKRESEANRLATEAVAETKSKQFMEQLHQLQATIANVRGQSEEGNKRIHELWRALSTPASAGRMSEIGLANLLKSLGLSEGSDFDLQFSINAQQLDSGAGIRPDALIYLPQDAVMVIDSKASIHLLEAGAEDAPEAARTQLKQRMQAHLKSLAGKEYKSAIEKHFRTRGGAAALSHAVVVMYLPNEAMLEHVMEADSTFIAQARAHNIIVTGPNGLQSLLTLASGHIKLQRQAENQAAILQHVTQLMDGAAKALSHVEKITKGMQSSAKGLEDFVASLNRFFLPRARGMEKLGVTLPKSLPTRLKSIEVRVADDALTIEADTNETDDAAPLLRVVQG